ncbi:MAG: transposase [Planctomycetota bacterium]|jgi:transposase
MKLFENEIAVLDGPVLDGHVSELAQSPRYRARVEALVAELKGVGVHVAMVFPTEVGDLPAQRAGPTSGANAPGTRFRNRREIAACVGLVPSSDESGDQSDRKGHITHQGSWRLRKALCQAAWSRVRTDEHERAAHARVCAKNPKRKKIATVAAMRRLVIRMWHTALRAAPDPARAAEGGRGPISMAG